MSKVLILGLAPLPIEKAESNYAPGVRTWQFTKSLLDHGHKINLVSNKIFKSYGDSEPGVMLNNKYKDKFDYKIFEEKVFYNNSVIQKIYDDIKPDCIIAVTTCAANQAVQIKTEKPIWVDLFGHFITEVQAKSAKYESDHFLKHFWEMEKRIIERADIFSVVSNYQKFSTIGELGLLCRLNRFTLGYDFCHSIPITVEKEFKHTKNVIRGHKVDNGDFVILWSGGYNTWTDIDTLFEALIIAMKKSNRIKFVSTGGEIAGHDELTYPRFLKKINNSKFKDRFIMEGWIPTEDVENYYFEADLGINIDKFMYEGLLGSRTRLLNWMKMQLPIITTQLSELTDIIAKEKLGIVFKMGDSQDLAEKIIDCSNQLALLTVISKNAKKYYYNNFVPEQTMKELTKWVARPGKAPDFGKNPTIDNFFSNIEKENIVYRLFRNIVITLRYIKKFGVTKTIKKITNRLRKIFK